MNNLILNINKIHTTPLGEKRIEKNLNIKNKNIIEFCKNIVLDTNSTIIKQGKNYYVKNKKIYLTINTSSFTIITAHFK